MSKQIPQGYKQTKVGIIPEDWGVVKLGEITDINPPSEILPNAFIYIDLDSVSNGKLLKQNKILKQSAPSRAQRVLQKNDILFQLVRPYQMNNLFFQFDGDYVASTGYAQIRVLHTPNYIYQYLHFKGFVDKVLEKCTGSNYPAITSINLSEIMIPLPSLKEQEKIADVLSTWDSAITKQEQLIEQKKLFKKGLMQQIFSQKIRFKDDNGNDYPDWEEKILKSYSNIVHGDGDWILSSDIVLNGEYKIIQLGNIGYGEYINKPLKTITANKFFELKCSKIMENDLLINRMVDNDAINFCLFNYKGFYITSVDICWIRENHQFSNRFLMYLSLTQKVQQTLLRIASGSGRIRISKKNLFENVKFSFPYIEEQSKIANFLVIIDNEINKQSELLHILKQQRKSLIQKLLTGQIRVRT